MEKRESATETITRNLFGAMSLIKKRLVKLGDIQAEHGIPMSHVQVLSALSEVGSLTITEISERFDIAKPNITPLVDRMIAAGLVDRVRSSADRRIVHVAILPAGRQKLMEIRASLADNVQSWSKNIAPDEFDQLAGALDTITRVLSKV